jgi:NAD(P)-dependent dehydrogenase (short-subunit alcohol dehydrogenase family)
LSIFGSYQATKGAIVNMTRALAVEWAPHAIRVNAVAPTYVRTELIGPILRDPELVARIEAMTPLRKLAEPADIAAAIAFLASPAATMITGHTLAVDGGFLAQQRALSGLVSGGRGVRLSRIQECSTPFRSVSRISVD